MIDWITDNLGTIIMSIILLAMVVGIIWKMYRDKKKGKSSCGCNCGHCAMSGTCHPSQDTRKKT